MSLHVIPAIEEEFGKPTFTRTRRRSGATLFIRELFRQ
jgi:hypothetical protein